ncbi:hypothetical protein IPH25_04660 [bacterium]|nr:MAG: hypothetical protein IPG37_01655 [bacterium]QQR61733.1 MAG: hypothetical protein IPH25_04660 [bacterium]QQR62699.1 MAG: hypothetical protein IPH67_04775 [bacterium]
MSLKNKIFILTLFLQYCHQDHCMEDILLKQDIANPEVTDFKTVIDEQFTELEGATDNTKQALRQLNNLPNRPFTDQELEQNQTYSTEFRQINTIQQYQQLLKTQWNKNQAYFENDSSLLIPFSNHLSNIIKWFNTTQTTIKEKINEQKINPIFFWNTFKLPPLQDFTNQSQNIPIQNRKKTLASEIITTFPSALVTAYLNDMNTFFINALAINNTKERLSKSQKIFNDTKETVATFKTQGLAQQKL